MDRKPHPTWRRLFLLITLLSATVLSSGGCTKLITTVLWVWHGHSVPPEWDGLEGHRVAVVCRPPQSLQPSVALAASELANELGRKLATQGDNIDVVDPREVAEWTDENIWDEFTEIGGALDADLVVGVEIDRFSLYGSQTIYQGSADVTIRVYDIRDGGRMVWSKTLPEAIWPPVAGGVPVSDKREADFRREFVDKLSDQIGRHFYAHDHFEHFADDASSIN